VSAANACCIRAHAPLILATVTLVSHRTATADELTPEIASGRWRPDMTESWLISEVSGLSKAQLASR
jgi:hypothetical protein